MNFCKFSSLLFISILVLIVPVLNDDPILPSDYVKLIGKGFDVSWSEFTKQMEAYTSQVPAFFAAEGFNNARIRINDPNPD